jgi:hypothetical protein
MDMLLPPIFHFPKGERLHVDSYAYLTITEMILKAEPPVFRTFLFAASNKNPFLQPVAFPHIV